jgi:hypothetical protein
MNSFIASRPKKKILRTYLDMINGMFRFTERERDVLSILFDLDLHWNFDRPKNIIDMNSRRYVMQNTFINKNNLSKYISKFKDKKILVKSETGWVVHKDFIPSSLLTDNRIDLRIIINTE